MTLRLHPLAPVVALDIDGTLGGYHDHFCWFASMYLQEMVDPVWKPEHKGEFSEALGLDKHVYRDIKLAYRQGGMKRSLPPYEGVRELVSRMRDYYGIQVWVTTTRPWNRLDNIDPDTQFWIDRNLGRVDGVIYGEDKYLDLLDIVGPGRIVGVVDDLPENIARAREIGLRAILRSGPHNDWWKPEETHPIANSTVGIRRIIDSWIAHDEGR